MKRLVHGLAGFTIQARCECGWYAQMEVELDHSDAVAASALAKRFGEHLELCAGDVLDLARAEAPRDGASSARTIYAQKLKAGVSYWVYSSADGRRLFLEKDVARAFVERDGYALVNVDKPLQYEP